MDWRGALVAVVVIPVVAQLSGAGAADRTQNASPQNATAAKPAAEIPFTRLTPDAVVKVELRPGSMAAADALWIPQSTGSPIAIDRKTNAPAAANGSPPLPLTVTPPQGPVVEAGRSLWMITDAKGVVSRVDPATRKPVAEIYVPAGAFAVAADEDAVWVTSETRQTLTRINPHTNVIVEAITVGPRPGPLAIGEGAVWTLNRGDGSISRVDVKANKVTSTIPVGMDIVDAAMAVGEGAVWLSAPGTPLVRIDPRTNRVTHRFTGDGGGAVVVAHGSVWVKAGKDITWRLDPRLVAALRP